MSLIVRRISNLRPSLVPKSCQSLTSFGALQRENNEKVNLRPSFTSHNPVRALHVTRQKKSSLLSDEAYINGEWVATDKTFKVKNPFNNEVVGMAADCEKKHARTAIEAAKDAFIPWKEMTAKQRTGIMKKWFDLIMSEKETLAELITLENGKPITQAMGEVDYASSFVEWYAEEGRRTYGITIPSPMSSKRMMTTKQPIGVVAMITPWNFPAAMVTRKACAALAAGCSVVLKPSEETPLSAVALAKLAEKAGFPPGVFNVIPASRSNVGDVGRLLCTHPSVAGVSFTGSTATGKILLQHAASTVKKVSLENGGNAPLIVFNSADVAKAVQGAIACKFRYSGQTCICANRILVQSEIHDEFITEFAKAMKTQLIVGDGMDPKCTLGPVINEAAVNRIEGQINDAVNLGAEVIIGGKRSGIGKNLFEPTLLTGVKTLMQCCNFETFGPIAPVLKFDTEEDAISIANNTTSGLAGYIFSGDVAQCWRVAEKLETGVVGINEGLISSAEAPFGGFKESGLGREGSIYGMDEFMEVRFFCWGV